MSEADTPTPPPEAPPPAPPGPPPAPPSGPSAGSPTVRIGEWFNEAWEIIKPHWLEYVVAYLVAQLVLMVGYVLCVLPGLLLAGPILGGFFIYAAKRLVKVDAEVPDVFKGLSRFVDLTLIGVIVFLLPSLVAAILLLPSLFGSIGVSATSGAAQEGLGAVVSGLGCVSCAMVLLFVIVYPIVAGTFFVFAYPLVLFKGLGAIDALKQSVAIVKPKFGAFLTFLLACWVILFLAQAVGSLLVCIGSLLLTPLALSVITMMQLLAYRDFVGLTKEDVAPYA